MDLPLEVKEIIASHLSYPQILSLCSTNKEWKEVCSDGGFWRELVYQRFPSVIREEIPPNLEEGTPYFWHRYYLYLENFLSFSLYITIDQCQSGTSLSTKEVKEYYFFYEKSFRFLPNFSFYFIPSEPSFKRYFEKGTNCVTFYYPVRSLKPYYTLGDFQKFFFSLEEKINLLPIRDKYLLYGPQRGYDIFPEPI